MVFDEKIMERIKKPIENNMCITKGSTPIIYFGNYSKAKSCTISLNPSCSEFTDKKGNILVGSEERLCSRINLNKNDNDFLTDDDAQEVIKYCNNYFSKNPLRDWFDPLNTFLKHFDNYSFYDDSCVHLDLVQWATTPVWGKINDKKVLDKHLDNDFHILEHLLQKNFEVIFLNGKTVVKNVIERLAVNVENITETRFQFRKDKSKKFIITYGKYNNAKIVGWNLYLQHTVYNVEDINRFCDIIKQNI